jgi:hypothetical protein
MVQLGYDREDRIINIVTGQPGRTPEQDSQDRTARSGQLEQDIRNRSACTDWELFISVLDNREQKIIIPSWKHV